MLKTVAKSLVLLPVAAILMIGFAGVSGCEDGSSNCPPLPKTGTGGTGVGGSSATGGAGGATATGGA